MKISCRHREVEEWEQKVIDGYGCSATICITTIGGQKYIFDDYNDCWTEGLESLYLKKNVLCHGFNDNEVLTPYDLAGIFYFSKNGVGDSWRTSCWIFNFLCGKLTVPQLVEKLKGDKLNILSTELQLIDAARCSREELMKILAPHMPMYSEAKIKPYIDFATEVKTLGEIESIDIEMG